MTRSILKFKLCLFLFLCSFFCVSQINIDDNQLWTHLKLKKELTKKLELQVKLQTRFRDNISELGRASANFRITYKLHKGIHLLAGYSFIEKQNRKDIFKTRHSYYGAVELKTSLKRFEFIYRNLFMCRYKSPFTSYDGYIAYLYDRNRITIKYEQSKRITIYLKEDINIPLNNPQLKGISRARTFIGTNISITKRNKLDLYVMHHQQFQQGDWFDQDLSYSSSPLASYIAYGIGYVIEF